MYLLKWLHFALRFASTAKDTLNETQWKQRRISELCIESVVSTFLFREEILVDVGRGRRSDARFEPGDYLKRKHGTHVGNSVMKDQIQMQ